MGQKVHPLGFRLGFTQKHRSQWYAKKNDYSQLVFEDFFLRKNLTDFFLQYRITLSKILIKRQKSRIFLEIHFFRKTGVQKKRTLKEVNSKEIQIFLKKKMKTLKENSFWKNFDNTEIQIFLKKIENPFFSKENKKKRNTPVLIKNVEADLVSEYLVNLIQNRVPFRGAIKKTFLAVKCSRKSKSQGIKIQFSGRLNGAEIARTEWIRRGRVPLHTLDAYIDYSQKIAKTIYGVIGIKVWLFKGEV